MGVIEKQSIQDIADAIRDRNGLTTLYKPRQMDEAIRGLYKTEAVNHIFDNLTISTTAQGSNITLTDADTTKQAEITELKGNTTQEGTPTPSSSVEVKTVSGDNNIVVSNKNLFVATDVFNGYITGNGALVSNANNRTVILRAKPNTTYTIQAERKGIVRSDDFILSTDSNYPSVGSTTAIRVFTTTDTEIARTFTTRATDNWIAFKVANISNSSFEETLATIQLEEGSQATSYIAHQGNSYRVDLRRKEYF